MPNVTFEKLEEHSAQIKGISVVLWRVRIENTIDEYYITADKVHNKLGGGYWGDSKHLIDPRKVQVAQAFESGVPQETFEAGIYLDIHCGQCGIVNTMNQSTLSRNQGSHFCKSCRSTIAVVIGKRVNMKNGSTSGRLYQR